MVIPTTFSAMQVSWKLLSSRLMLKRVRLMEWMLGQYTLDYDERGKHTEGNIRKIRTRTQTVHHLGFDL